MKTAKSVWALCAAIFLLLSGCIFRSSADTASIDVYRVASEQAEGQLLAAEKVTYQSGENVLDVIRSALNSEAQTDGLEKAFPDGVTLSSCSVSGGVAAAVMSGSFLSLEGIDRVLAEYALTCTLMQLNNVMSVNIVCLGDTVSEGLTSDDAILADSGYEGSDRIVKLFVPNDDGSALACRTETVSCAAGENIAELVLRREFALLGSVPDTTQILSINNENGRCTADLSEEFFAVEPDDASYARLVISAICNTLAHLPNVNSVVLEVNGREMTSYGGYITVWPMSYDESLVPF